MFTKITIESRVLEVLRKHPTTRYDDILLYLNYCETFCKKDIGEMKFGEVLINCRTLKLPDFTTIIRARKKIQSLYPELSI